MTDHIWVLRKDGKLIGCGLDRWNALADSGRQFSTSEMEILCADLGAIITPSITRYTHGPFVLAMEDHPAPTTEEG